MELVRSLRDLNPPPQLRRRRVVVGLIYLLTIVEADSPTRKFRFIFIPVSIRFSSPSHHGEEVALDSQTIVANISDSSRHALLYCRSTAMFDQLFFNILC
jgi:hypothetical protein